jgi:DNA-binding LytR/AlgR family response regulator
MIRIVLVDDEPLALEELAYLLTQSSTVEIIGQFTDPHKAIGFVGVEEPDLVFVDINMPTMDGMAFADALNQLRIKTQIVFATAYDDYALKAFEKNALDYVMKPYMPERLFKVLHKYNRLKRLQETTKNVLEATPQTHVKSVDKLAIWSGDRVLFVSVSQVLFCEVHNNQVLVYTDKQCFELPDSLSSLEEKLPKNQFLRTHRSFIINLKKVKEASPYFNHTMVVLLEGSTREIPVSRSYVKQFKEALSI